MIVDKINNIEQYSGLNISTTKIKNFIKYVEEFNLEDGRYDTLGDNMFALIETYYTKPVNECKLESHEKHIDLQYIIEGREFMNWASTENLVVSENLLIEEDLLFYENISSKGAILVEKGFFAIFFPNDAHMPKVQANKSEKVKKIVFKIKYQVN